MSVLRDMVTGKVRVLLVSFGSSSCLMLALYTQATSSPQVGDAASRAPMITPEDAIVNFNTMTAEQIERRSRAISHQVCYRSDLSPFWLTLILPKTLSDL